MSLYDWYRHKQAVAAAVAALPADPLPPPGDVPAALERNRDFLAPHAPEPDLNRDLQLPPPYGPDPVVFGGKRYWEPGNGIHR